MTKNKQARARIKAHRMYALTDGTASTPCDYKGEYQFTDRLSEAESKQRHNDLPTPVFVLPADDAAIERMREAVADLCAIEIATAYTRGHLGTDVVTRRREDIALADAIMAKLGLTAPAKRTREMSRHTSHTPTV